MLDVQKVFRIKFDSSCLSSHEIFIKSHSTKETSPNKPLGRTLFIMNVPPWVDYTSLRRLFAPYGPIEAIYLQKQPSISAEEDEKQTPPSRGFKFAYVVFERPSSVKKVLTKKDDDSGVVHCLNSETNPILTGIDKWRREYNKSIMRNMDKAKSEIENWVSEYDRKKEAAKAKAEAEAEPDEEGWITVSRHTTKKAVGKISAKAQAKVKAREQRRRKRKELENFYKFQVKESKLKKLEDLKAKFEIDKKKQIKLKQERKFKPL